MTGNGCLQLPNLSVGDVTEQCEKPEIIDLVVLLVSKFGTQLAGYLDDPHKMKDKQCIM